MVLVDADGRRVDLHPVIFDRHGNGWQDLGADAWGAHPAEELTATGVIAGRSVRCNEALATLARTQRGPAVVALREGAGQ